MEKLYRKKQVVEMVGAAKSTVSDWIDEFADFLEIVEEGRAKFYKPSAIEVLKVVKELREEDMPKAAIAQVLVRRGFAVNAEPTKSKIETAIEEVSDGKSDKQNEFVMALMASMTRTVEKLADQDVKVAELERKQAEYKELMKELRNEVAASREKSAELEAKIKAMEEEKPKGFLAKLFGGK